MFDNDRPFALTEELARLGNRSQGTVYAWITRGRMVGAERIYLKAFRDAGLRWCVYLDDYQTFLAALNSHPTSKPQPFSENTRKAS